MDFHQFLLNPTVDIRSAKDYVNLHLNGAANFPVQDLMSRLHELPSNQTAINLFGDPQSLAVATQLLEAKNYRIDHVMTDSDANLEKIIALGLGQKGNQSKALWKPAGVVDWFVKHINANGKELSAVDLACGAGRDSLFLAKSGWNITAVDHSASALEKVEGLCLRGQPLQGSITTKLLDIEANVEQLDSMLGCFDAIIIVRYLHRPLLNKLEKMLNKGGYIIYQTFLQGCEQWGSPKNPRYLLEEGELRRQFGSFTVLLDDIALLPDGRPTNRFVARKN